MTPIPESTMRVPNPGSDEALMRGCICAVIDNAHGRGYMGGAKDENGATMFVITCGCPVHAPVPATAIEAQGGGND